MTVSSPRGRAARQTLRRHLSGVLSTHSKRHPGFPYGSAVPHHTDASGCPVILISELAEHTQNLLADARVSFLASETGTQLQAASRLTLIGQAQVVDRERCAATHLGYHPDAQRTLELGGFHFFRIIPEHVRFIEGFGGIHWLAGSHFLTVPSALDDAQVDIIAHMNKDHADTLRAYCRFVHHIDAGDARMIGIDQDGFDVRIESRVLRFDFDQPVTSPEQARVALIELARRSRT